MEVHIGGKTLYYLPMFKLTQTPVVEPNGRSESSNVELCQQIGMDSTPGDEERTGLGAAT